MIALSPGSAIALILAAVAFVAVFLGMVWKFSRPTGEALLMKAAMREYRRANVASRKGRLQEANDHMTFYYDMMDRVKKK